MNNSNGSTTAYPNATTSYGSFGGIGHNAAFYNGSTTMGYGQEYSVPQTYYVASASTPTNLFYPVPETKKEEKMEQKSFSAKTLGVQIIYRFGNSEVKTQILKGLSDLEKAQELFLDQFGDDDAEPEIVAAVEVLVSY